MITDHDRFDRMEFMLPVHRDLLTDKTPTERAEFVSDLIRDYVHEVADGLSLTIASVAGPVPWPTDWTDWGEDDGWQMWRAWFAWLRLPDRETDQ